MVRSKENLIAAWAFLIGVILAILIGIFADQLEGVSRTILYIVLVLLGGVVGYWVVEDSDSVTFLIASLSIVIVGGMGNNTLMFISNLSPVMGYLVKVLNSLLIMFIPATIIVALKTVFSITKI